MDGGWGWGERAAPIPDPPIQAFLLFFKYQRFLHVFILENKRSKSKPMVRANGCDLSGCMRFLF